MKVSINFMYYTKLVAFFCICLLKTSVSKIYLCTYIPSIYPFLPLVLMYIDEIYDSGFLRPYSKERD